MVTWHMLVEGQSVLVARPLTRATTMPLALISPDPCTTTTAPGPAASGNTAVM